jgi:pimeloyl-ACP methyl ester carboxylesterase
MNAQDVQRFVSHAPACTHAVLEGTGHGIHEERPAEYVQASQRFLAAVSAQGARA